MRNKKRYWALGLTACMLASVMAGCGSGGGSDSKGSSEGNTDKGTEADAGGTSSDKEVKLTMLGWEIYQQAGMEALAKAYHEQHPNVTIDVQISTWSEYWTKLEATAISNQMPDIFWMHTNEILKYADYGKIADLTDLYDEEDPNFFKDNYSEVSLSNVQGSDGRYYGVPKDKDTVGLVYNREMFDAAGVSYPDETWTWDTFAEAAQKLTNKDNNQYGFASPAAYNQDGYYNMIYDMGGYIVNDDHSASGWDSPETIAAMNWWYDNLVTVCMPTQQMMGENTTDVLFGSGRSAMTLQGSWMVKSFSENEYIAANADVAVLPKASDGTRKTIYNGLGWAASAESPNAENAWKLLEYLGSETAQKKQADTGVTMSAYIGTSDNWVNCAPNFHLQAYLDMTKDMVIRPYTANTKIWEDYSQQVMVRAYTAEITMEEACKEIANFMNEQIAQE